MRSLRPGSRGPCNCQSPLCRCSLEIVELVGVGQAVEPGHADALGIADTEIGVQRLREAHRLLAQVDCGQRLLQRAPMRMVSIRFIGTSPNSAAPSPARSHHPVLLRVRHLPLRGAREADTSASSGCPLFGEVRPADRNAAADRVRRAFGDGRQPQRRQTCGVHDSTWPPNRLMAARGTACSPAARAGPEIRPKRRPGMVAVMRVQLL